MARAEEANRRLDPAARDSVANTAADVPPLLTELLEREAEFAVLAHGIDAALEGDGSAIYLEGEAGIGKTELVAAVASMANRRGLRVLRARGDELEHEFSFGVARQLFEHLVTRAPAAERRRLLAGAAQLGGQALGVGARAPVEASQSSVAIQHGLYWLTVNLSDEAPLFLAMDDAHWADDASLRFVLYLTRRLEGLPILLVVAARAGEPRARSELLAALAADARVTVVRPAALSPAAVADIVRRRRSPEADDEFCAACHEASGGNPFMLGELLNAAEADAFPHDAAAAAQVRDLGPATISRAMLLRLARLPEGSDTFARGAALLGAGAEFRHAAALAGLDDEAAATAADALTASSILRPSRPIEFVHPLVRQAIYRDIPPARRALQHARAARLLGNEGATPERVAAHLLEAEPRGDAAAVDVLRKAAREATRRGDPVSAASYLRRALQEPPDRETRSELLVSLGDAQMAVANYTDAASSYEGALEASGDVTTRTLLFPRLKTAYFLSGQLAANADLLDRLLEEGRLLQAGVDPRQSAQDHALAAVPEFRWQLATEWEIGLAETALADAALERWRHHLDELRDRAEREELDDPYALAVVAAATAYSNGAGERSSELAERALRRIGHVRGGSKPVPFGIANLLGALLASERYDRLDEVCREGSANARRLGSFGTLVAVLSFAARGVYRRGALAEAEAYAREALNVPGDVPERLMAAPVGVLVQLLVERGALAEADGLLVETGMADTHGTFIELGFLAHTRGRLRVAQGRVAEGIEELLSLGTSYGGRDLLRSPGLWCWRSDAALALLLVGEKGQPRSLAEEELELARELGTPRAVGIALRAVGLVTGGSRGLGQLRASVEALEGSPARLELARSLFELGSALRRANQRADARDDLRRALDLARRCGAASLEARAREEIELAGGRPLSPFLSGAESLTPAERRVAAFAAKGLSNPEIAQALFLTRKTIETHLGHVYRKLNIASRDQLAGALAQEVEP
jgi:DNA-binding CsgD family transcriptional regulator